MDAFTSLSTEKKTTEQTLSTMPNETSRHWFLSLYITKLRFRQSGIKFSIDTLD